MRRFAWPTDRNPLRVVALMSGTSLDGIDAAVVEVTRKNSGVSVRTLSALTRPYTPEERERLHSLCRQDTPLAEVCAANFDIAYWFAEAAQKAIQKAGLSPEECDLVASHGQTIWHIPGHSTLQIGEAAVIAEVTGLPVVSNFRARDIAAGGQGAPLASYVDFLLFSHPGHSRAVQNIGGIGNVTWLPAGGSPQDVISFDTGPGNMVINEVVSLLTGRGMDENGHIAATGRVSQDLLEALIQDPFFATPPPKTTGREKFGEEYARNLIQRGRSLGLGDADLVATATMLTVRSIRDAYRRFLPHVDEVILAGGGVHNTTLVRWLCDALDPIPVRSVADYGIDPDFKEAVVFAVLGAETAWGNPANLPSATGARRHVILGDLTPP
ncbi:MAG: anhydro-N-acetylmuramic acid kinase [Armatimonadota bacterium]|nr:anhydro-N-acetylmuramic acid kinase [Armatimonadota bacterium]